MVFSFEDGFECIDEALQEVKASILLFLGFICMVLYFHIRSITPWN